VPQQVGGPHRDDREEDEAAGVHGDTP
jgi:hypothetical protein